MSRLVKDSRIRSSLLFVLCSVEAGPSSMLDGSKFDPLSLPKRKILLNFFFNCGRRSTCLGETGVGCSLLLEEKSKGDRSCGTDLLVDSDCLAIDRGSRLSASYEKLNGLARNAGCSDAGFGG